MLPKNGKADLLLAATSIASLAILAVLAYVPPIETAAADLHFAQASPPVQASPPDATPSPPAEAKPGGTRPTTPAPEPATPTAEAQKEGAKSALPPAPAEKMAPPMPPK